MKSSNFVCEKASGLSILLKVQNIIAIKIKFFLLQVLEEGEMIEKSGKLGVDKGCV